MESRELKGKCSFCEGTFSKTGMTNHLKSCMQRKITPIKPSFGRKAKMQDKRTFHLTVEGTYHPEYWMHIEVPAGAKLEDLDDFLREIWVECYGHLSAFTIRNIRYELNTGCVDAMWSMIFGKRTPTKSMNIRAGVIMCSGLEFNYEYDFGTTTYLTLFGVILRHTMTHMGNYEIVNFTMDSLFQNKRHIQNI